MSTPHIIIALLVPLLVTTSSADPLHRLLGTLNRTLGDLEARLQQQQEDLTTFKELITNVLDKNITEVLEAENVRLTSTCSSPYAVEGAAGEPGPVGPPGPKGDTVPGPQGIPGQDGIPGADANVTALTQQLVALQDLITSNTNDLNTLISPGTCGGFIELDGNETQISHTLPAIFPTGYQASCVWVVWAPKGGPIKLRSSLNYPASSGINLVVAYNDGEPGVTKSLNVLNTTPLQFFSNYISIHLLAKPTQANQQLRFGLTDEGQKRRNFVLSNLTFSDGGQLPPTFAHPSRGAESYEPRERLFAIYKASPARSLNLVINRIDVESCCDWIEMTWLNPLRNPPQIEFRRFNGAQSSAQNTTQIQDNTPMVLSFISDDDIQGEGFALSQSYV